MSKKTDRRNAILCLNKIRLSGKQSDIENFYFKHCTKFKPSKHKQKPVFKYTVVIKSYVFPAPRDLVVLAGLGLAAMAAEAGGWWREPMKFDMLGKFKRTRYNNYKYKIVMA